MNNAEMDAWFTSIENTLPDDPTDAEVIEAARVAFMALTKKQRRGISLDELQRRLAVYGSVELE